MPLVPVDQVDVALGGVALLGRDTQGLVPANHDQHFGVGGADDAADLANPVGEGVVGEGVEVGQPGPEGVARVAAVIAEKFVILGQAGIIEGSISSALALQVARSLAMLPL